MLYTLHITIRIALCFCYCKLFFFFVLHTLEKIPNSSSHTVSHMHVLNTSGSGEFQVPKSRWSLILLFALVELRSFCELYVVLRCFLYRNSVIK